LKTNLVYFISDIHLGLDTAQQSSKDREKILAKWLLDISSTATEILFLGDIFDYWFEYKNASTLQYPDFYHALKTLRSRAVTVQFFTGNHDMWMKTYFTREFGIEIHYTPMIRQISQKQFYLAHGDGLGKGDYGYKLMKTIMRNPISVFLYGLLPSKMGLGLMKFMSQKSREKHGEQFLEFEQERLVQFCLHHAQSSAIDFYVMGHRHLMIDYKLKSGGPRYINLGDWIEYQSYAVFDGQTLELRSLLGKETEILR